MGKFQRFGLGMDGGYPLAERIQAGAEVGESGSFAGATVEGGNSLRSPAPVLLLGDPPGEHRPDAIPMHATNQQAWPAAVTAGLLWLAGAVHDLPADPAVGASAPSGEEVEGLVNDLGHDEFVRREAATRKLSEMGAPALQSVLEAAMGEDPEVKARAGRILVTFADSFEPGLTETMLRELEARGGAFDRRLAKRAEALAGMITGMARNRSATYLSGLGLAIAQDAESVTSV
ncbi:MAG: hypothetical protein GWO24_26720, partial [Akkermansiaceae bacterium]|nr:hypothetical protein [Akkermansiaceae bacterium]